MCAIARERQTCRERQRQTEREDSNVKKKANKMSVICSTTNKYKQTFSLTANVR